MEIENFINDFITNNNKKFSFEELKQKLPVSVKTPERIILDILEESPFLFKLENSEEYLPRHVFFKDSAFLIAPTDEEIDEGILIPGHKFLPFYNQDLFPAESFDINTENGEPVCVKQLNFTVEDLHQHYFLLGAENIIDYFVAENPNYKKKIGNAKNKIKISVFDLKEFYRKHSFSSGDMILIKVLDWTNGIYQISYLSSENVKEQDIKAFSEHFEESLCKVFDKHGQWLDIPEQLAMAYFQADSKYLKRPVIPVTDFLNSTDSIQIKFIENHSLLWNSEKIEEKNEYDSDFFKISSGTTDSLEAILNDFSKFLTSVEVIAFIKDSLQNEISDSDVIRTKIFPEGEPEFTDEAQKISFNNYLDELIEEISENFIKIDTKLSDIRANILSELENFYILYETQIKNNEVKIDLSEILKDIMFIRKILEHLNNENLSYPSDEEVEHLDSLVFGILSKFSEKINNLELE